MKVNRNFWEKMEDAPKRYKMCPRRVAQYSIDGTGKNGTMNRRAIQRGEYNLSANYGHSGHSSWWD